jgi:hypothetical protein
MAPRRRHAGSASSSAASWGDKNCSPDLLECKVSLDAFEINADLAILVMAYRASPSSETVEAQGRLPRRSDQRVFHRDCCKSTIGSVPR